MSEGKTCPDCGATPLIDAEEPLPEDQEAEDDWFCEVCGGLFDNEEVEESDE